MFAANKKFRILKLMQKLLTLPKKIMTTTLQMPLNVAQVEILNLFSQGLTND
jgi:hypothetical protein